MMPTRLTSLSSAAAVSPTSVHRVTRRHRTIPAAAPEPKLVVDSPQKPSNPPSPSSESVRPVWLPGLVPPPHLDGSMPGDYGFDPLNLGKRPSSLYWFRQAELQHARWAMLGAAGIIFTAALKNSGFPPWYEAGEVALDNLAIPFGSLIFMQAVLMGFVEVKRWMDICNPGSQAKAGTFGGFEAIFASNDDVGYPGGVFNPLKFEKNIFKMKQRELANGRLAMVACLGFAAQYYATGTGPLENLLEHVDAPLQRNFATNGVSLPAL